MGTAAAARTTARSRKKTSKRTDLRLVRTPKKRVKERPSREKAFDVEHFGRPPKGATHVQLRRVSANGDVEKLIVVEGGFEIDKFPLERVSVAWLRQTFGPGHYRGNWFAKVEGKWTPLGQMQALRLSSTTTTEARAEARPKALRTVGFPFAVPAAAAAEPEDRSIVHARVRAEREIAEMRIRAMGELEAIRLEGLREEHRLAMKMLEQRMQDLVRRVEQDEEEEDDDEEEAPAGPPGPWDFLRPLIEQAAPLVQQALPTLLARITGTGALPETTKG
jgi:hypothetical protein